MRTTLDIDDDVLRAAKELARREGASAGMVLSRLARQALTGQLRQRAGEAKRGGVAGFRPFPSRGSVVSDEMVDALRDAEGV